MGGACGRYAQMLLLLLLLVPVLVCIISHEAVRGIGCGLVGTLPPAGRIHYCISLHADAAAAAIASVAAAGASVVVGGVAAVAVIAAFPDGGRRRRGVAGHGVAGVWTVVERNVAEWELAVLVQLLKL